MPIRILHVLGKLNRGGAETLVMNWYRNVDRSKIQFDFVIHTKEKCSYTDEILSMGGRIFSVPAYSGINHFQYCAAWNHFFKEHPEYKIIHGHVRSTGVIYMSIAKRYGKIVIAHSHSMNSGTGIIGFVKKTMQYPIRYIADYKWACSYDAGKYLFGKRQIKRSNFKVVKNAIDLSLFTYNVSIRDKMRNELGIRGKIVVGHVGRFIEEKNHVFLLDVFEEFLQLGIEAELVLVGVGPLMQEIKKKTKEKGIDKSVIFLGERSDVGEIMQAFDVFVFPSIHEGLGNVAIEAQASGLPVLASENVPMEAKITDIMSFLSIDNKNDVKKWSNKLTEIYKEKILRNDTYDYMIKSGYEIKEASKKLVEDYLKILC